MGIEIEDLPDGVRAPGPGLYRMSAAAYHADPAPEPSLSSSLIPMLALPGSTPAHVFLKHPRLGTEEDVSEEESEDRMNVGSVIHELLLGNGGGFEVCDVKTWASKDAKALKAAAIEAGKSPIKIADFQRAKAAVAHLLPKLDEFEETRGLFGPDANPDLSEVAAIFQCPRTGVWGRILIDRWGPTPDRIWDLKTSLAALSDDFIQRQLDSGLSARAWWYLHGVRTLVPEVARDLRYRFIFAEQRAPFELLIREPKPEHLYVGERQAMFAALRFRHCLKTGVWPGFPRIIQEAQWKPWAARDWEAREQFSEEFRDVSRDALTILSPFNPSAAGLDDDSEITA